MKKLPLIISIVVIAGIALFLFARNTNDNQPSIPRQTGLEEISFSNPKKGAHYESNTPEHGSRLPGVPVNVVVNFNFDLAPESQIQILKDSKDYAAGTTQIDQNKLTLRRNMDPDSPDGLYKVEYRACWPDGSCHDGYFQFAIDRKLAEQADDLRNQREVEIDLEQIAFQPQIIHVSKGTKITWHNHDSIGHYVNTDSHPAHTYYPAQNSKLLNEDETYALTFDIPGVYPYHCSAHAERMPGMIIVE